MPEQRLQEEVSFPRGGGARQSSQQAEESSEQNKKRKSLQASTETDFLFGKKDDAKTSKKPKKRKASSSDAQSLLPLGGGGVVVTASKRNAKKAAAPTIEALGFSKLAKNTKVLAVVRELQNEFAVVSLPNLLTGYILPSTDYSLPSSLKLGQTLAVCVQKVVTEDVKGQATPRRRIQVSPLPLHVNVRDETMFQKKKLPVRGQMTSVEDHGCLVDLGLGRRGFLKYEDIQGKYHILGDDDEDADYVSNESKSPHILQPGRLLDFYVSSKKNQVYALQLPSKKTLVNQVVAPPATSKSAPYTLASITPGWLVNAKIEAMAKNGLCVTFLGSIFRGAIELGHLGGYHIPSSKDDNDGWKILFHKHQHFPARVVAVDVPTKLIRLTLLPHLLELKVPPPLPSVGSTIEECTVIRNDPGIGALLALPESYNFESNELSRKMLKSSDLFQHHDFTEASAVRAVYVHISKALEGEKDTNSASIFGKEFAISTKHTVRILSHGNMMDGVASGACALSILEAHVLTYGDLKAGQVYKQVPVVAQLQGGSILVQLGGDGIRALIPKDHLIDSSATNSEYRKKIMKQKFAVDAKVDVRVMWVDPLKKKCFATTKKSLVKASEDQIISSYQELKLGERATGFVSKVDNKALYITFCNRVFGKVTSRSLAAELGMENVHDNYTVGDVVTCRIVKLKKRTSRRRSYSPRNNDGESNDEDQDAQRAYWEVTLSLKVDGEDRDDAIVKDAIEEQERIDVKNPKQVQVQAGAILPMKSMKIVELIKGKRKTKGGYIPGYAIVSIKSKHLLPKSECGSMESNMECKLPYDQILDDYAAEDIESVEAFDALAESVLTVGKKINQKGIILTDPRKSNVDFLSGIGRLAIVSIRKNLIQTAESQYNSGESSSDDVILPTPNSRLFVGALLRGYVVQVDPRYGGFVRFLDGLTGIIPKKSGGLNMPLFQTVVTRVKALDDAKNQILLEPINTMDKEHQLAFPLPLNTGDKVDAIVKTVDFLLVTLDILDEMIDSDSTRVCLHCTMKESSEREVKSHPKSVSDSKDNITKGHPFYGLKPGQKLSGLSVLSAERRKGLIQVHLTDRDLEVDTSMAPIFAKNRSQLKPGTITSVIVTGVAPKNKGLYVEASPFVKGFVPGLELSKDLKVLNRIGDHVSVGSRIRCCVMDQNQWHNNRAKNTNNNKKIGQTDKSKLIFSVLACKGDVNVSKPTRGDVIVGRIQRGLPQSLSPSLMLSLRGGYVGRCCITELDENDEWENMPVGRRTHAEEKKEQGMDDSMDVDDEENENDDKKKNDIDESDRSFPDGKYVECRVLKGIPKHALVDVSLRDSRVEGDLDDDDPPEAGDTVQGYVVETNKKGCFVRLSRNVEGRVTLKELCDGFLPDPKASFPSGRLVVGRVKEIRDARKKANNSVKFQVDLDMRESTLLDQMKKLSFEDIKLQRKYKGTVARVESYGVFVQIENSNVSGLTHMSECSDKFIKNLGALYDPGDLVKVLVIKKDTENKNLGFSMKASHFEDDTDSEDDSSIGNASSEDEDMIDIDGGNDGASDDLDSDDENFGAKLAVRLNKDAASDDDESNGSFSDSESEADEEDSSGSDDDNDTKSAAKPLLDINVGFDWGAKGMSVKNSVGIEDDSSKSDSDSSDSEDDGMDKSSSHKSRKKQARRRREEQEITRRESALADGTADENPETAGDFERLLAGNPNSSELWIRYMAFYLSLADIPSARKIAEKGLARIEFREEKEILNVWTALLTLEHKYGTYISLQGTVDEACGHCNPKQVYLRVCEILEKDSSSSPESVNRANDMFAKMCKKFKSKKKVWLAHLEYLLKQSQHQEAHALLKRAILSLAAYKHAETMSKFAQLEFEYGSAERARTVFDGIVEKYPRRLDLFFVYLDKEVKFGKVSQARALLERKVEEDKLSDKQMKSLFKKWFRMEEQHGNKDDQERVKDTARKYVQK